MASINVLFIFILLVCQQCSPRGLPEEDTVVSVYTTQPSTGSTHVDVYHQIANNIAERITSPIYRFLGINRTKTEATTKRSWDKVELLDEPEAFPKSISSVNNEISDKDVEELSAEALKKIDKKPEKITLYNSYLPSENIELNDTVNEVDNDTFGFDDLDDSNDDDTPASKRGLFVTALEIVGSVIQLIYGSIAQLFSGYLTK